MGASNATLEFCAKSAVNFAYTSKGPQRKHSLLVMLSAIFLLSVTGSDSLAAHFDIEKLQAGKHGFLNVDYAKEIWKSGRNGDEIEELREQCSRNHDAFKRKFTKYVNSGWSPYDWKIFVKAYKKLPAGLPKLNIQKCNDLSSVYLLWQSEIVRGLDTRPFDYRVVFAKRHDGIALLDWRTTEDKKIDKSKLEKWLAREKKQTSRDWLRWVAMQSPDYDRASFEKDLEAREAKRRVQEAKQDLFALLDGYKLAFKESFPNENIGAWFDEWYATR